VRKLVPFATLSLLACATTDAHFERPGWKDRWRTLRTLGLVEPVVDVMPASLDPLARDALKRETAEIVLAAVAAELGKRGVGVRRLSPEPSTRDGLAALAHRFDAAAEAAGRAGDPGAVLSRAALGEAGSLSHACGVDGFVVASATALAPRGAPRPSSFASAGRTNFQILEEAEEGVGPSGEVEPDLSWLAVAVVDGSGELLWAEARGAPGEDEGDPAAEVASDLAERLPGAP